MIFNFHDYFNNKVKYNELSENDTCRIAAYFTQNGLCYVTKTKLKRDNRELHHRTPRSHGGKDKPENLVLLDHTVHLMVHAITFTQFNRLLEQYPLTNEQLALVNQLRYEAYRQKFDLSKIEKTT